ncbi:Ig-like domain-containing protein [Pseudogulbenkiania sp. MAI-1]|uniref:Ig-like domain-containing protein n=1 Tax=Pseudogulbenkiania sp. MAI-1 TaxID=990370 RepID=UPI00045E8280|nr:Ig-like domain-containing protein [Pseudogulbenkiania sp. MAI-1]
MFGTAAAPCGQRGFFTRAVPRLVLGLMLAASLPSFAQSTKTSPQNQGTTTAAEAVEREGELEVVHVHNVDKTTGYRYFLRSEKGRVELKFKKRGPRQPSGTKVKVKGSLSGNVLALDSTGGTSYQVLALPAPNTLGEQRTAVLLVNFQDNQTQPYTAAQANTTVFGSSNDFFKENSSQQTWLSGNVFGWYTLPIAQTCSPDNIAAYANQAAAAAGVDLSLYPRRVYVIPRNNTCAWSGMGTVGGSPSSSWLNGALYRGTVTHEMGHNLSLWHSHSLDCGTTTLGSSCSRNEYGDPFDTMGNGVVHYNAFQKERLGWLNYGTSPRITTIESSGGTFTLEPYAAASSGTKALKVLKSIDPTTGQKTWYYVEFRQPIGFDSDISRFPQAVNGVLVHTGTDGNGDSSDLLDITPNSSATDDISDSPLGVGQSFTDSTNGITISLLSVGSSGATVSVSVGGQSTTQTCKHANPNIALSPGQSASVAAGTPVTYTLSVTNADSSACSSSVFNLAASVPAGWSKTLASPSLTLAPGASASTTLTVTSPTSVAGGSYGISATAANGTSSGYSASASVTYIVASSSTTTTNKPPVALNDSASTLSGTAVKVAVLANDSDPEGKPLSLKSVGVPSRGKAVINSDGTVTYTPNGKFKGADSFSYTISDGVNSASANVAVQVNR